MARSGVDFRRLLGTNNSEHLGLPALQGTPLLGEIFMLVISGADALATAGHLVLNSLPDFAWDAK